MTNAGKTKRAESQQQENTSHLLHESRVGQGSGVEDLRMSRRHVGGDHLQTTDSARGHAHTHSNKSKAEATRHTEIQ